MKKMIVNICDVCNEIFAGGDAPKDRFSKTKTEKYQIPIYSNGEANDGLYGYTDFFRVNVPSITVSARGTIGYISIREEPFVPIVRLITLVPNLEMINIRYLYYAIQNYNFADTGTSIPQLTVPTLKKYSFPLPETKIQERIVEKLDEISKIIENRKKQVQQLDELVNSRFTELFGDTVINPKQWEEHKLEEYIEFLTSGSRGWSQYFVDTENELFITIKNVKNNHITLDNIQYVDAPNNKEAERTKVKAGDLLISITADLGRTGIVDEQIANMGAYINQHLSLVRLDTCKINPLYVSYFLETEGGKIQFESKNQTGVKAGLNFEAIKSLKILVPPLNMQNEYVDFVEQLEKAKQVIKEQLEQLETLKKSLMQKYFG